MLSVLISVLVGAGVGLGLGLTETLGYGWSSFFGVLSFGVAQFVMGRIFQKRLKGKMEAVQAVLLDGQKKIQAKMARWQMRPPGSIQAMQAEIARDQRVFVTEALARTEDLRKFMPWVPMMARQIATAQFQLFWMIREFKKVDELMPKTLFIDPTMKAMKIARMYMLGKSTEDIAKVYTKAVVRLRYNENTLLAATYSWILVQRNDIGGAHKVLVHALEKSDNETLKANRDNLANNRVAHFSNSGLGEQWYALMLEEPKVRPQRQRMQWR